MKMLKFYDLKRKKSFMSNKYTVVVIKGRRFAKTTAPSGSKATVIMGKA